MAHKREMEAIVISILHASKLRFKTRLNGVGARNTIFGTEIESTVIPLSIDIYNIIESWILRRRLDIFGLQNSVNEFSSPCCHFHLQRIWDLRFGLLGRTIHPHLLFLCHAISFL